MDNLRDFARMGLRSYIFPIMLCAPIKFRLVTVVTWGSDKNKSEIKMKIRSKIKTSK